MTEILETPRVAPPVERRSWIGERLERHEDERLLRGLGRFTDDVELPRALHMAVGRSPFARARIVSLDASRALELDGVAAVLTGEDVATRTLPLTVLRPLPGVPGLPFYAIALDVALWEGQPVVSVVARDRYLAEDALDLVEIEYEPLPHVVQAEEALAPGAPKLQDVLESNLLVANPRGPEDIDPVFATAEIVERDRFVVNRVTGLPMEGRATLASYTPGLGTLDVWSSTQVPHVLRRQLAHSLRIEEEGIRVIAGDLGGGFGLKLGVYPEDVLACLHTLDLHRPVKWIEDRTEHFRSTTHAREAIHQAEMAAAPDGRILAMRSVYLVDGGAYNSSFGSPMLSSFMFSGPYNVPDTFTERRVVVTNKVPVGAYRGYGQPESCFVREVLVDRIARRVGVDRVELRRRNMLRPEDLPWRSAGGALYDSGDYVACLDLAAERIGYAEVLAGQAELRADGRHRGVGVASFVEMTGYPGSSFLGKHGAGYGGHESVTLRANRSGGFDLYTGVAPMGQATETAYAQVAATVLGVHPARIRVHAGDSLNAPYNTGSFASRTLIAGAGAISAAGTEIRAKAIRVAAHMLEVEPERLDVADGVVRALDDPGVQIPLAEVATNAIFGHVLPEGEAPGLEATAYFDPIASAFGYGSAAALVEVDAETGEFGIERLVFVHDCGPMVNPTLVEGQLYGGIAQALGAALFEELVYDRDSGQLANGTMLDYFAPTACDLPEVELAHRETPSPVTPFGIRGIGETGTIPPAAAIANAICDALSPFGAEINRLPLTPEYVWSLLHARSG